MEHAGDGSRPEVERGALRDLLLSSLPDGIVRWGAQVEAVEPLDGHRHRVRFSDGRSLEADLLIGADGAWSKVRPLLSPASPEYLGVSFVESRLPDADANYPAQAAMVGNGSLFALSDEKGLLGHREGNGELSIYVAVKMPEAYPAGMLVTRNALLAHFADWHTDLQGMIVETDGGLVSRPLYALPTGHRWDRVPGVTLIGDAAHVMSPFAGEGANLAMLDGAELALALVKHGSNAEAALGEYEATMFPRSQASAAESASNLIECLRPDAPQGLVDMMTRYGLPATDH